MMRIGQGVMQPEPRRSGKSRNPSASLRLVCYAAFSTSCTVSLIFWCAKLISETHCETRSRNSFIVVVAFLGAMVAIALGAASCGAVTIDPRARFAVADCLFILLCALISILISSRSTLLVYAYPYEDARSRPWFPQSCAPSSWNLADSRYFELLWHLRPFSATATGGIPCFRALYVFRVFLALTKPFSAIWLCRYAFAVVSTPVSGQRAASCRQLRGVSRGSSAVSQIAAFTTSDQACFLLGSERTWAQLPLPLRCRWLQ